MTDPRRWALLAIAAVSAVVGTVYSQYQPVDPLNLAVVACQADVRDGIRTPKTAEFQPAAEWDVFDRGEGRLEVRGYVDAQNGFGALIRNDVRCHLQQDAAAWRVLDAKVYARQ